MGGLISVWLRYISAESAIVPNQGYSYPSDITQNRFDSEDEDDIMPLPINSPASKSVPSRGCFSNAGKFLLSKCFSSGLLFHVPNISSPLGRSTKGTVASALQSLDKAHQLGKLVDPGPILQVMDKIAPTFVRGRQQDAHEFMALLLDALVHEAGTVVTPVHHLFSSANAELVSCEKCYHTSYVQNNFPMIPTAQFHGFNDLEEAVNHTLQPESVISACTECGHGQKKKVCCLLRPANYLCVHIPRFTTDNNGNYVKSKKELLMNKSLRSSGHYTAFCLDQSNVWYHFDDSKSTPINMLSYLDSEECQQNAYIALYQKKEATGEETPLQSLSQLIMSESSVCAPPEPPPPSTRAPRRKLLQAQSQNPMVLSMTHGLSWNVMEHQLSKGELSMYFLPLFHECFFHGHVFKLHGVGLHGTILSPWTTLPWQSKEQSRLPKSS
ncbi:ubiquitin carboxyl-terminal hydrolase 36-like [Frankliniella occidentalis]|uniref:Ubiquitin carboxyl-terminal hydrolase 36-like n=1 Tax=Frankliniella occidentalis TaxID=133901 RepID=A0A9C6X6F1_FRAOC|nr:ubiquitin carboxyl-terminal hydrolase 36-like [Frankliniella occidentalis]